SREYSPRAGSVHARAIWAWPSPVGADPPPAVLMYQVRRVVSVSPPHAASALSAVAAQSAIATLRRRLCLFTLPPSSEPDRPGLAPVIRRTRAPGSNPESSDAASHRTRIL